MYEKCVEKSKIFLKISKRAGLKICGPADSDHDGSILVNKMLSHVIKCKKTNKQCSYCETNDPSSHIAIIIVFGGLTFNIRIDYTSLL